VLYHSIIMKIYVDLTESLKEMFNRYVL